MNALDALVPAPRLVEVDSIEIAAPPERTWDAVRHGELAKSPLVRALFAVRTRSAETILRLDDMASTPEHPGFQLLVDDPPRVVAAGAIGEVWQLDIPFVHVDGPEAFGAYDAPGKVKVAWSIEVTALGTGGSRVTLELRVDATDDDAWKKFRRYFLLVGPGSRFIRHSLLAGLRRELGSVGAHDDDRPLPGDDLLEEAGDQVTHGITIRAKPEAIWPWLVQMGCRRAGYYSIDVLDNGGRRSAREIHPELQDIRVGQVLPATPKGDDGFEVLRIDPGRALVLGGLFDAEAKRQLPFDAPRPERYWHVTWSFVLLPLDGERTRLLARARVAFGGTARITWMRPIHDLMETAQLRNLRDRVEGRIARDDLRDVLSGAAGAAIMIADLLTPFLRPARSHWGVGASEAAKPRPGDELVPEPRWQWTHGIEIERPCEEVWPWIAQIGADRAGFYSYQWLENIAGCNLRNAEAIHPEWEVREGDGLSLHPKMPPLRVVSVMPGRGFIAYGAPDEAARARGESWAAVTWAFLLEPLGPGRCRFVSRYRCATSGDLGMRLSLGPTLVEPVGFAMDRRMLLGVKRRAEATPRPRRQPQPSV